MLKEKELSARTQEKNNRNEKLDRENVIRMLKTQRYQIDDMLLELGGIRFQEDLFDADTMNDMIQSKFRDIVTQLNRGGLEQALEWAEEGAEKEWLKVT